MNKKKLNTDEINNLILRKTFEDMENVWSRTPEEEAERVDRAKMVQEIHTKTQKESSQVNGGCFGAFIGGFLSLGVIPLVLAFTGHGGWVIVTSLIPSLCFGMAIGCGIGVLIGSRVN